MGAAASPATARDPRDGSMDTSACENDAQAEGGPDLTCVVCFEALPHDCAKLPCACKVAYCGACWERALAASLRSCGTPRCPTCRAAVRTELAAPADGGEPWRLRYSLTTEQASTAEEESLSHQARAAQVQQLAAFGDYLRSRRPGDAPSRRPPCACGGELRCCDVQERAQAVAGSHIVCDVCHRTQRSGNLWSCQRGDGTIVHPFSHDVCLACFEKCLGTGRRMRMNEHRYQDDFGNSWKEEMQGLTGHAEIHLTDMGVLEHDDIGNESLEFKHEDDFGASSADIYSSDEHPGSGLSTLGIDFGHVF